MRCFGWDRWELPIGVGCPEVFENRVLVRSGKPHWFGGKWEERE